MTLSDDVYCQ